MEVFRCLLYPSGVENRRQIVSVGVLLKDSPIFASNPKGSVSRTLLHCNSKSGMHQSFVSCKATECCRTSCQSNPQAVHYIHVCNHICAHMSFLIYIDRQILRCVLFSCLVNCHIIQVSNIGCLCVTSVSSFLPTRHHVSNLPRYMNHPAILRPCNCEIDTNYSNSFLLASSTTTGCPVVEKFLPAFRDKL